MENSARNVGEFERGESRFRSVTVAWKPQETMTYAIYGSNRKVPVTRRGEFSQHVLLGTVMAVSSGL